MFLGLVAGGAAYFLYRRMCQRFAKFPRRGASWDTLVKRAKYRGGRKARSASRHIRALHTTARRVENREVKERLETLESQVSW